MTATSLRSLSCRTSSHLFILFNYFSTVSNNQKPLGRNTTNIVLALKSTQTTRAEGRREELQKLLSRFQQYCNVVQAVVIREAMDTIDLVLSIERSKTARYKQIPRIVSTAFPEFEVQKIGITFFQSFAAARFEAESLDNSSFLFNITKEEVGAQISARRHHKRGNLVTTTAQVEAKPASPIKERKEERKEARIENENRPKSRIAECFVNYFKEFGKDPSEIPEYTLEFLNTKYEALD